jgi:hypothetical protein
MAEVISTALDSFGKEFDQCDLADIADQVLDLLPIDSLAACIVERLESHGWDKACEPPDLGATIRLSDAAAIARLAWAEVLADVDGELANLDGSEREPPNLGMNGCPCRCGCNGGGL